MNSSQVKDYIATLILSGGRRTMAQQTRDALDSIVYNTFNKDEHPGLANVINSGSGNLFLADDGTYKSGGGKPTEVTKTIADFGTNTFVDIITARRVAYVIYRGYPIENSYHYDSQSAQTTVRIDISETPDSDVIIGLY